MTVHCEGDCRIIEQLGEKQDFESELSQRGFQHEQFTLHVSRAATAARPARQHDYSVLVTGILVAQQRVYTGGPRHEWVREFARDLASGIFGEATLARRPLPAHQPKHH